MTTITPDSPDFSTRKKTGRRKIKIEFIDDKSRRQITFSKRKAGLMKKAYELTTLTGTQALLLVASETGHVYTFATPKLQPFVTLPEGKNLIQACLNAPDSALQPAADMGQDCGDADGKPPCTPSILSQLQQALRNGMPPDCGPVHQKKEIYVNGTRLA